MDCSIGAGDPNARDVVALLTASEAHARSLYPPESVHMVDIRNLTKDSVRFLVARSNEGIAVGCGAIVLHDGGCAEVKRLFVSSDARGNGLGARILEELEAEARRAGICVVRLETGVRQFEAISLYRKFGYRDRGPFGTYRPDPLSIFMEKVLAGECTSGGVSHPTGTSACPTAARDGLSMPCPQLPLQAEPDTGAGTLLMEKPMNCDRFMYDRNIKRATKYRGHRSALWPPARDYRLFCVDIACEAPRLGETFDAEMTSLRDLIEAEWNSCKARGVPGRTRLHDAETIAGCLRRIATVLLLPFDRRALKIRAHAAERGYEPGALAALAEIDEDIAIVAGQLSTWFGKQTGGLPTAFGCRRDAAGRSAVAAAVSRLDDIAAYMRSLHAHLRLGDVPAFAATNVFFMAGEGNRHPKHIAYFLPEDEGIKRSPFKKTYYFVNTHRALMDHISLPLARRLLDVGRRIASSAAECGALPTLGVLAHEMGHFVHRENVTFAGLNAADRWASVVLQEMAADVFGMLIVTEVLASAFNVAPADVVVYHLAECLRYVDRGLGFFPDCDGMYLQLNYLAAFGALTFDETSRRLVGDPEVIIAGFRSLARVLADTLLAGDVRRATALYLGYGAAASNDRLAPLIGVLRDEPQKTIEYLQEPVATSLSEAVAVAT